jgi:hypothetical protein
LGHTYNSSYSGGRDWENCGSRPAQQKVTQIPISTNKPGKVIHVCDLSYLGGIGMQEKWETLFEK